ncbi:2-dehydropantoate 2-reductase [Candidatus Methylomirabilis sp.]|uniref:2-dehydropantoate 2-reductase n=1 Tax=Candidatus Methylomirabilis tolerans TaxID=3123416 RepID=A0AAJ1EJL0_9BACT|nr:2-dehydropantoate 2-reductase [Candidatus Methylomirabilis sp.]
MKVAVVGVGAVGGYFGGLLAKGGADVTFIARGKCLEALRTRGLTVRSAKGDFSVRVRATDDPTEIGTVDLLLFCVKSYDTESAIRQALPMVGQHTVILSLQNGIDNEEKIASLVGKEKVLAGVAYIGASVLEPGAVLHQEGGKIMFGEVAGDASERVIRLKAFFDRYDLPAEGSPDMKKILWTKLAWNAPFNAINTLVGGPVKTIIENPHTFELARRVTEEVVTVAHASGVPLAFELVWERNIRFSQSYDVKTSMLQDLEAGKPLECEALNGVIIKKAVECGLKAPYNFALYALLSGLRIAS